MKKALSLSNFIFNKIKIYLTGSIYFIYIFTLSSCATLLRVNSTITPINTGLKTVYTFDVYADNSTIHSLFSGLDKQFQKTYINLY